MLGKEKLKFRPGLPGTILCVGCVWGPAPCVIAFIETCVARQFSWRRLIHACSRRQAVCFETFVTPGNTCTGHEKPAVCGADSNTVKRLRPTIHATRPFSRIENSGLSIAEARNGTVGSDDFIFTSAIDNHKYLAKS